MKPLRVAIAVSLACLSAVSMAADPIIIKFTSVVATDTPKGKGIDFFAKRAAELTSGQVKVEHYPNSTLYKDKEELEALQMGAVQMAAISLSKFGPLGIKEFEVFDLPYIFRDYEDLHKVTYGAVGRGILDKLDKKGIAGLAYWDNGFKVFSSNKAINSVSEFKGQKMRIQSSKVLDEQMRALNVLPQVMAFSEAYQALQTGVVDGTENPPSNLYTQKMFEVQKYVLVSNHGYLGYAVVVNKKFWDGLPTDIRDSLSKAMDEATKYTNEIAKQENEHSLEQVRASGKSQIIVPSEEQKKELQARLASVHKKMESRLGKDLIASFYQATGFDPSK